MYVCMYAYHIYMYFIITGKFTKKTVRFKIAEQGQKKPNTEKKP